jgi:hypothetical protein
MHNFRGFTLMPDTPGHALAIRELPDGGVEILYDGTHTIERAASLRGPWLTLGTQSGPMTDTGAASEAVRFYRINDNGVYSENVVGFYQLSLCNGFSLIANQLNAVGGNRISNLFKSPPEGTRVYKFNPALGGFVIAQFIDGAWEGSDAEMTLNPGEGAFMQTSLTSHRFLGDVPSGNLGVQIPQGFSLISNHLPEAGPVNLLPPDGIGLPVRDGTRIYQWHCLTQGFLFSQYVDGMWERDGSLGAPTVAIGEAFYFYNPGPALTWNRSFSVGQ